MKKLVFIFALLLFFTAQILEAQHMMGMMRRERLRKMEQLEKAKLIELLNMDDETAIKFFAIRNKNIRQQKRLNKIKDKLTDSLRAALKEKEQTLYEPLIQKIIDVDKKLARNRMKYFNSLRRILNKEQIAKLLVFEATFKNEIKRMLFMRRMR